MPPSAQHRDGRTTSCPRLSQPVWPPMSAIPSFGTCRGPTANSSDFVGLKDLVQLSDVLGAQVDLVGLVADGEANRLARFGPVEIVDQCLCHFCRHALPFVNQKDTPDFQGRPRGYPSSLVVLGPTVHAVSRDAWRQSHRGSSTVQVQSSGPRGIRWASGHSPTFCGGRTISAQGWSPMGRCRRFG